MKQQLKESPAVRPIAAIKQNWQSFASLYSTFDNTMHTFYYTLIHMLSLQHSNHILEVGCGTAKLLPLSLHLKPLHSSDTATDLSENMITLATLNLQQYLTKMGVDQQLGQSMNLNNLHMFAANAEEKFEAPFKFDRIIANLVLMITEDPAKMLRNLHGVSEDGCLLGLTVWGNKALSNFIPVLDQAILAHGGNLPNIRSNFHLYNKIGTLAEQNGWEVVVIWQQNAPFNYMCLQDQNMLTLVRHWCKNQEKILSFFLERVKQTFVKKNSLNFPVEMAVLKKKRI